MNKRIKMPEADVVRVPLTPAQHKRLMTLSQNAAAAGALRDNVLSALVEGVVDKDMQGYTIQITEDAIVLRQAALGPVSNGQQALSQADAMSP